MPRKRKKPEEIVPKPRQANVLTSQGPLDGGRRSRDPRDEVTYYRKIKDMKADNARLRRQGLTIPVQN